MLTAQVQLFILIHYTLKAPLKCAVSGYYRCCQKKGSGTHTSLTPPVIFCCALQVNQITAFIDGSNVYGSDVSTARRLRLGRRGRLRVTRLESEDLLPLAPEECADHSKRQYCFAAGNKEPLSCPDKLFSIQSSDLTRCLFRSKAFT